MAAAPDHQTIPSAASDAAPETTNGTSPTKLADDASGDVACPTDLPTFPEDVTVEWLSKVLKRKVQTLTITKITPGTATKLFLAVTYEDNANNENSNNNQTPPTHLCIKAGLAPPFIKAMPFLVKIYRRECDFYTHIAPALTNMTLPRCHFASHTATQGLAIMDDLAALGHAFGDPSTTWPVSQAQRGVEQLAALHAKTWGVRADAYPWLTSDYDEAILTLMRTYGAVVSAQGRPEIPAYLKDQARVTAVLEKHFAARNPRFRCLLHGDAHTANTYLVGGEGGAPRFLDWQMIHLGSAFHDVAYFVGAALSVEDRRAHEWDVVEHYLRTLERFGVERLERGDREVVEEYRKGFLAGVGWIMCPYEMQPREFVHPMAKRYAAALDDHKVLELVEGLP